MFVDSVPTVQFKGELFIARAEEPYPFQDNEFDLVISLTTLHLHPCKPLLISQNSSGTSCL